MLLTIVYILLNSVYFPYILLVSTIFLAPLATSSHTVIQGRLHLLYFLEVVAHWAGVVIIAVCAMITTVAIGFLVSRIFVSSGFLGVHLGMECLQLLG